MESSPKTTNPKQRISETPQELLHWAIPDIQKSKENREREGVKVSQRNWSKEQGQIQRPRNSSREKRAQQLRSSQPWHLWDEEVGTTDAIFLSIP